MADDVKLKPCPFCGGEDLGRAGEHSGIVEGRVRCDTCGAIGGAADEAWNRRPIFSTARAALQLANAAMEANAQHMIVRAHPRGREDDDVCTVVTIAGAPELSARVIELLGAWDAEGENRPKRAPGDPPEPSAGPWDAAGWRTDLAVAIAAPGEAGEVIAHAHQTGIEGQNRANARLMAAAPNLLAACRMARAAIAEAELLHGTIGPRTTELARVLDAAIAKVRP
jgi:hypothetical protein